MTDAEIQGSLSSKNALALTIWGESRGEPIEGQIAVGWVIRNRVSDYQRFRADEATYASVCLAPKQFSCWFQGGGASNYHALMAFAEKMLQGLAWEDAHLTQCLYLADGIISGALLDNTNGATHYFAPAAMQPPYSEPTWARGLPSLQIGSQLFLTA